MACQHETTYPVVIEDTTDHYCCECGYIVRTVTDREGVRTVTPGNASR